MPLNVGSSAISKLYVGSSAVDKLYLGSNEVWSNFSVMGMDKGTSQSVGSSYAKLVDDWTIRSGFAGTNIVNSELVMNGPAEVTATASASLSSSSTNGFLMIYKNGVQLEGFSVGGYTLTVGGTTAAFTVAAGDTLSLYARTGVGSKTVFNCYLYISKVPL